MTKTEPLSTRDIVTCCRHHLISNIRNHYSNTIHGKSRRKNPVESSENIHSNWEIKLYRRNENKAKWCASFMYFIVIMVIDWWRDYESIFRKFLHCLRGSVRLHLHRRYRRGRWRPGQFSEWMIYAQHIKCHKCSVRTCTHHTYVRTYRLRLRRARYTRLSSG